MFVPRFAEEHKLPGEVLLLGSAEGNVMADYRLWLFGQGEEREGTDESGTPFAGAVM